MNDIIFKPKYTFKLWFSFFSPAILSIILFIICVFTGFNDKSMVFFLMVTAIAFFVIQYVFYRSIAFKSVTFSADTIIFKRYFFKPVSKRYADFGHIRERMISFGDIGIMLYELDNSYEILQIVKGKIKQGELIEKSRTKQSKNMEKIGVWFFVASVVYLLLATIISPMIPYHIIDATSDILIVYILISIVIMIPIVRYGKKKN